VKHALAGIAQLYLIVIFVRVILSWFPISPDSPIAVVYRFVYAITEPVLAPIRRVMPSVGFGGMGLDLSPLIVLLVLELVVIPALR
jgi:YggT family protein